MALAAGLWWAGTVCTLSGQERGRGPQHERRRGTPAQVAPEHEAAARAFAKQHHPELLILLDALKKREPRRYAAAIRELYQTSESLNRLRERDRERYEAELRLWKATSRVRLLAARLTMGQSDDLEQELRRAIAEQIEARIALQRLTRDRLRRRLAALERAIAQAEANKTKEIERRLARLRRLVASGGEGQKKAARGRSQAAARKRRPAGQRKPREE